MAWSDTVPHWFYIETKVAAKSYLKSVPVPAVKFGPQVGATHQPARLPVPRHMHQPHVWIFLCCRSYAKGFALFGALYSFNECVIEKHRAKHDRYNAAYAGCATGGMLAYSGEFNQSDLEDCTTGTGLFWG